MNSLRKKNTTTKRHISKQCIFQKKKKNRWDEWLTFPLKYNRLSIESRLEFTVWRVLSSRQKIPIAKSFVSFFDNYCMLNRGRFKMTLLELQEDFQSFENYEKKTNQLTKTEVDRLEHILDKYNRDELAKSSDLSWLDSAAFEKIAKIKKETPQIYSALTIELSPFEFPIVYHEKEYKLPFQIPASDVSLSFLSFFFLFTFFFFYRRLFLIHSMKYLM